MRKAKDRVSKCSHSICALITVLGRPMRLDLCCREGARSVEGSRRAEGRGHHVQQEQGRPRPHALPQSLTG